MIMILISNNTIARMSPRKPDTSNSCKVIPKPASIVGRLSIIRFRSKLTGHLLWFGYHTSQFP